MRIDLHCHTLATKGEGRERNVTPELFAEKIDAAQVDIVAVTNHNHFDLDQYELLREAVDGAAQVWPGVELDIERWSGGKPWHMIVITSPDSKVPFSESIKTLQNGRSPKDCSWPFEEIWEAFKDSNALFISHCHDKAPAITEEEIARVGEITNNDWRFYFEPRTLLTLGIWSNHGFNMLMGSDVKDWSRYEEEDFVSLRVNVDSFEQFYLLAKRDHQVVETLLNRKRRTRVIAHPHDSVAIELPLYQDINVLFGQKGTGKSEIVKSIRSQFEADGIKIASYIGGQKNTAFDQLMTVKNEERSCSSFGRSECLHEIQTVIDWADELPTPISHYIQWLKTVGNSDKKDRFKLSECQSLPQVSDAALKTAKGDYGSIDLFITDCGERDLGKYLKAEDSARLFSLLEMLRRSAASVVKREYINKESTALANNALIQIKNCIDKKSDTQSKPSDTGFLRFALGRISLLGAVETIKENMREGVRETPSYLGTLEDKGRLDIVLQSRWLCSNSKTAEFGLKITTLKNWRGKLNAIASSICCSSLPETVEEFKTVHQESGVKDLSAFIGLEKYVIRAEDGKRYSPSDGEKGILVIERTLNQEADVYLLDEPELGMGNLYIDSVIRPKLMELALSRKTVVVATHNANIAVRTLPYLSIYRRHMQGDEYRTYLGNPFLNELTNIDDQNDRISWSETSITTLEGGFEAFYDRQRIYEAGKQ